MEDDQSKIEEAKRLMAGPLGEQLAKFPLRFAKAAFFGEPPLKDRVSHINNGTVSLVDLGSGPIVVTCAHVIEGYREKVNQFGEALFQIGHVTIDPNAQLISESVELDLATLKLSDDQVTAITRDGEIGSCFFKPVAWPSPAVSVDDYIAFGGFPGIWRERISYDELVFPSFSSGASRIATASEDKFASQFEREYWVQSFNINNCGDLRELGGLSGGPAFILRGLYWDFVGVIYEFSEAYDIMFLRPSGFIHPDGTF